MARTELTVLCWVALAAAGLRSAPASAQEAAQAPAEAATPPAETAPAVEPAPAICPSATSLKECTAACQKQFPPKPKVELPEDYAARARLAVHGWWAVGAGAALLVAGGITGGVALHFDKELAGDCPGGSCPPARHADLDTRDRLAVTSTVLIAGGVAASAVGILILTVFSRTPKMTDPDAEQPAVAFAPAAGPGATGAVIGWRF